ncbi:Uma2 family endonuclease [Dyadobacter subterraneus]|uniref:Uma2 family endonuclease n=1 Tax=Dyadobacter subterraneus TaxID=2773304 RepID=A0ABR9WHN8_9BACT|nr:Uma2 family endonuclease [Dyadobacter subterraneus]MBE9465007.1 Uma2 family endonuclease [Dyadobacter subterraneus]
MTLTVSSKLADFQDELRLDLAIDLDDDSFYDFCQRNPELRFERNPDGTIIIMPLTGGKTGIRNSELSFELVLWNRKHKLGQVFDSSTGFKFQNGATRSPDMAWISNNRWNTLSPQEQDKFPPISPDFVVALMSATDKLKTVQDKMHEYINNGVLLGWLINPKTQEVFIYREDGTVDRIHNFNNLLSGENILPHFEFDLTLLL